MKKIFAVIAFAVITLAASAQSANFDLAKSLDVQNSILKVLSANYVDSVQFNKLINTGDALFAGPLYRLLSGRRRG